MIFAKVSNTDIHKTLGGLIRWVARLNFLKMKIEPMLAHRILNTDLIDRASPCRHTRACFVIAIITKEEAIIATYKRGPRKFTFHIVIFKSTYPIRSLLQ